LTPACLSIGVQKGPLIGDAGTLRTPTSERRRWELDASGRGIVLGPAGDAVYLSGQGFRLAR
jgi:hypothetical protein